MRALGWPVVRSSGGERDFLGWVDRIPPREPLKSLGETVELGDWRLDSGKCAQHRQPLSLTVVASCVGSLDGGSLGRRSALPDVAVLVNEEVVANIVPATTRHVEGTHGRDDAGHVCFGVGV